MDRKRTLESVKCEIAEKEDPFYYWVDDYGSRDVCKFCEAASHTSEDDIDHEDDCLWIWAKGMT